MHGWETAGRWPGAEEVFMLDYPGIIEPPAPLRRTPPGLALFQPGAAEEPGAPSTGCWWQSQWLWPWCWALAVECQPLFGLPSLAFLICGMAGKGCPRPGAVAGPVSWCVGMDSGDMCGNELSCGAVAVGGDGGLGCFCHGSPLPGGEVRPLWRC